LPKWAKSGKNQGKNVRALAQEQGGVGRLHIPRKDTVLADDVHTGHSQRLSHTHQEKYIGFFFVFYVLKK
jgi:hypothetical protein